MLALTATHSHHLARSHSYYYDDIQGAQVTVNYVLYELTIQNISKGVLVCSSFLLTSLQSGHISFSCEKHRGRMVHVCGLAQGSLFIFGGALKRYE